MCGECASQAFFLLYVCIQLSCRVPMDLLISECVEYALAHFNHPYEWHCCVLSLLKAGDRQTDREGYRQTVRLRDEQRGRQAGSPGGRKAGNDGDSQCPLPSSPPLLSAPLLSPPNFCLALILAPLISTPPLSPGPALCPCSVRV